MVEHSQTNYRIFPHLQLIRDIYSEKNSDYSELYSYGADEENRTPVVSLEG